MELETLVSSFLSSFFVLTHCLLEPGVPCIKPKSIRELSSQQVKLLKKQPSPNIDGVSP